MWARVQAVAQILASIVVCIVAETGEKNVGFGAAIRVDFGSPESARVFVAFGFNGDAAIGVAAVTPAGVPGPVTTDTTTGVGVTFTRGPLPVTR
jgi:hypothetical protein